jgi:hypothetical protein
VRGTAPGLNPVANSQARPNGQRDTVKRPQARPTLYSRVPTTRIQVLPATWQKPPARCRRMQMPCDAGAVRGDRGSVARRKVVVASQARLRLVDSAWAVRVRQRDPVSEAIHLTCDAPVTSLLNNSRNWRHDQVADIASAFGSVSISRAVRAGIRGATSLARGNIRR